MTGPTRRRVLTGCAAGLTGLAGCAGLPGFGDETGEPPEYDREELERAVGGLDGVSPPDAFPVALPAALQDRHRERAREYLDAVPSEPSFPNEAIATQLADDRSEAAAALDRDASGRPRDRLDTWRSRRRDAATVMGSHMAATGEVDRDDVRNWRGRARSRLATFESTWEYRATGPVAAAVVHATLEEYVAECRRRLDGRSPFPENPGDAVFEAGDVVGDVDGANAAVVDAGRVREQYRHDARDPGPHRQRLSGAAADLGHSVSRTTSDLERYVDARPGDVFDRDLEGTPATFLFSDASRAVEWRSDGAHDARRDHTPATAVVEAGRALVAAGALEAVVEAIRDGRYQERPSVDDVEAATDRALDALEAAWETTPQSLAVELADPALLALRDAARRAERGHSAPSRVLATVVHAEAQALAVPAARDFVAERLQATERQ